MKKIKQNRFIFYLFSFTAIINFIVFTLDPESIRYLVISIIFFLNACLYFINSRKAESYYWKRWRKIRERGRWYYSAGYGMLIIGVSFSFILSMVIRNNYMLIILLSLIGGLIWGLLMWMINERGYKSLSC
ncbi:hypothetical protein [Rossellomorea sp. NS-SX7]|uniref:hypothetical protein n=1 Tax=Rossellomorea sp. NS-SX7 TaxID=3463856 RepID=UPI0040593983